MKIWFLTGEFAPDFGGGIGTYVENCAKMFAEAGDDVTVIVRSINGDKTEKAKEEILGEEIKGRLSTQDTKQVDGAIDVAPVGDDLFN